MRTTERQANQTNEEYFYYLTNTLGFELEIAHNYIKKDGGKGFSKWIKFNRIMEVELEEQLTPETWMTRQQFVEKATHRSVGDIEIMIDIDEAGKYKTIKEHAKNIIRKIKNLNIIYSCYFSGSKSYHISILIPHLRYYSKYQREKEKLNFLKFIGSDLQKASSRNMIALEGVPHWKTGNIKEVAKWETQ